MNSLSIDEIEFLTLMAIQLNETLQSLDARQHLIESRLGSARVGELRELWIGMPDKGAPTNDISLDATERELFFIWLKRDKLSQQRRGVGRRIMVMQNECN